MSAPPPCCRKGRANVYLPGGQLRPKELSVYGSIAIAQLRHYWFDQAFIGFSGLTDQGLFDYSLEDTEIKRAYHRTRSTDRGAVRFLEIRPPVDGAASARWKNSTS